MRLRGGFQEGEETSTGRFHSATVQTISCQIDMVERLERRREKIPWYSSKYIRRGWNMDIA
jgi:hypothetical protein